MNKGPENVAIVWRASGENRSDRGRTVEIQGENQQRKLPLEAGAGLWSFGLSVRVLG